MQRGALSGNPQTTAGRGGSALRSIAGRVFGLGQQSWRSTTWRHHRQPANKFTSDLSLDPSARAELERIAEQDRRSVARAASLLLEATLRARQGDVSEGAAHG